VYFRPGPVGRPKLSQQVFWVLSFLSIWKQFVCLASTRQTGWNQFGLRTCIHAPSTPSTPLYGGFGSGYWSRNAPDEWEQRPWRLTWNWIMEQRPDLETPWADPGACLGSKERGGQAPRGAVWSVVFIAFAFFLGCPRYPLLETESSGDTSPGEKKSSGSHVQDQRARRVLGEDLYGR